MDPLAALSTAGTVVHFVEFALKILTTGHRLYQSPSGSLPAHEELKWIARDLSHLATRLSHHVGDLEPSQDEIALVDLCSKCEDVARDLLDHLKALKIQGRRGAWKNLRLALKATWAQRDLDALVQKLQLLRKAIDNWFLVEISNPIDSESLQQLECFNSLDAKSQKIVDALLDSRTSLPQDLLDQRKAVAQMLDRMGSASQNSNRAARATGETMSDEVSALLASTESLNDGSHAVSLFLEEELKTKQDVEISILESLRFSTMTDRLEEISEAHQGTFKWIYESQGGIQSWSCFTSWLKTGTGIYWINGKAGSGKSTLMRYIYDHPTTQRDLAEWAAPTPLSVAGFFFWNSGTKEQRSQLGLLQALLFEVLDRSRDLIPVVLPWLWAKRYSEALEPLLSRPLEKPLTSSHMMQAFTNLIQQNKVPLKLCLFIDGLDEYEGDFDKIVKIFEGLAHSQNVKICVSSRPLLVFEDSFSKCPGLKLQDLTLSDIKNYVNEELKASKRYQRVAIDQPILAAALEQEIVTSAGGVFLWVRLVIESLLSGLGNRDDIHDLRKRLRMLPTDLEMLYHHMLTNRIDPVYMDQASKMFKIIRETSDSDLSIFAFALTDEAYCEEALSNSIRPWNEAEIAAACQKMEDRMKAQCAGLIEVSGAISESTLHAHISKQADGKVQYLHRTVKDYLERPDIYALTASRIERIQFDVHVVLLQSWLLQLKTIPRHFPAETPFNGRLWDLAKEAMQFSSNADLTTESHMALLDQLGRTINAHRRIYPGHYPEKWSESFLAVAVQYNLWSYVERQLGMQGLLKQGVTVRTLLAYALGARGFHNFELQNNKEMVRILLKHATKSGTNSNIFKTSSIWQQVLQTLEEGYLEPDFFVNQFEVIRIFLQYGADPQATCNLKDGRELSAAAIIREGLVKYPHPATADILGLLDSQESLVKPKNSVIQRLSSWSSGKSRSVSKKPLI